jgi:hypothetical protein
MDRNIYDNVSACHLIDVNNRFALLKYNFTLTKKRGAEEAIKVPIKFVCILSIFFNFISAPDHGLGVCLGLATGPSGTVNF